MIQVGILGAIRIDRARLVPRDSALKSFIAGLGPVPHEMADVKAFLVDARPKTGHERIQSGIHLDSIT